MTRRDVIVGLVLVAVLGLGVWWFFANFERVTEQRRIGAQPEARQNWLLAAQRFIRRMGVPALSRVPNDPLAPPLAAGEVFILASGRGTYTPRRNTELLDWVEAGGHLIVVARKATGIKPGEAVDDPLLQDLGVRQVYMDRTSKKPSEILGIKFPNSNATLKLTTARPYRLRAPQDSWDYLASDGLGQSVIDAFLGDGRVTVLSDATAFSNRRIGKNDHAEILWRLVNLSPVSRVWIEHTSSMPSLASWLWQHASEAIITLAVLVVFALWRGMVRFGPVVDLPAPVRRAMMEQIAASGRFFWRTGRRARLLKALRRSVLNQADYAHPGLAGLTPEQRGEALSRMTKLPERNVFDALYGALVPDKRTFVQHVRTLTDLRNKL